MARRKQQSVIAASWQQIIDWLKANAPDFASRIEGPAKVAELKSLQKRIGLSLPDDVIESYRLHNGGDGFIPESRKYLSLESDMAHSLLSIFEIDNTIRMWRELNRIGEFDGDRSRVKPSKGVQRVWWHDNWVPFTSNGGGDHYCIDLAPTPSGTVGQIICAWHDNPVRHLVAPSLSVFINKLANHYADGRYRRSADGIDYGIVKTRIRDFPYCGR